jgi:hypothetical protein
VYMVTDPSKTQEVISSCRLCCPFVLTAVAAHGRGQQPRHHLLRLAKQERDRSRSPKRAPSVGGMGFDSVCEFAFHYNRRWRISGTHNASWTTARLPSPSIVITLSRPTVRFSVVAAVGSLTMRRAQPDSMARGVRRSNAQSHSRFWTKRHLHQRESRVRVSKRVSLGPSRGEQRIGWWCVSR